MVDVEQRALAALEEDDLALVDGIVQDQGRVGDERLDLLRVLEHVLDDLAGLDGPAVEDLGQELVLLLQGRLHLLHQDRLVVEVLDADPHPVDLVGVRRTDTPARRTDLALPQEALGHLVERDVVRSDQMSVAADQKLGRVDASLVQTAQLGEQDRRVDHDTVPDDRGTPRRQDSGGEEMQCVLLVAYDDRVTGVVAALVTHHIVHGSTEEVGGLPLALVTPLSTEQHKCGHRRTPLPGGACPRSGGVRKGRTCRTTMYGKA